MTQQILLTVIPQAIMAVVTAVVAYYAGRANKKAEAKDQEARNANEANRALKDGLCALLRVQLIEYHDRYTAEGKIPHYVLENYEKMYTAYAELGGNGVVTAMRERVQKLPQY